MIQSFHLKVSSDFLFLLELVLVVSVFLEICPFHLHCLICWHTVVSTIIILSIYASFLLISPLTFLVLEILFFLFFPPSFILGDLFKVPNFSFIDFVVFVFSISFFLYSLCYYILPSASFEFHLLFCFSSLRYKVRSLI